jgi:hypothetical protein
VLDPCAAWVVGALACDAASSENALLVWPEPDVLSFVWVPLLLAAV